MPLLFIFSYYHVIILVRVGSAYLAYPDGTCLAYSYILTFYEDRNYGSTNYKEPEQFESIGIISVIFKVLCELGLKKLFTFSCQF